MTDLDHVDELEYAGKLAEARDLVISLADRCTEDQRARAARLLARGSELALYTEGPERGEQLARNACEAADASGDPGALAHAHTALARVHLRQHTDTALDDVAAALDAIDADSERPDRVRATELKLRGLLQARRGNPREALDLFDAAYQLADGHAELRARVLLAWAVQLRNWGLFAEAQRRAERSLEIRLQLGDHYGAAMCYGVLAFIYQRQGVSERERDALAADMRVCQRIGGTADLPALHGRLAGALVGLGKYAGAWAEADKAIELETRRLRVATVDTASATRVHAYAWREQARVCLAQGRPDQGRSLAEKSRDVFANVRDGYGEALARLTGAELAVARAQEGSTGAGAEARAELQAAAPVFVRLGAVPEAVETILLEAELEALASRGEKAARRIVQQVLPMLQQAGLGDSQLFRRAGEVAARLSPELATDRVVTQASMLRSLAAIIVETDPQDATVVAVRVGDEDSARTFARTAVDHGAVVSWPGSDVGLAVVLGDGHGDRASRLIAGLGGAQVATATGTVDLEHMWPAGVRARGDAIEQAQASLAGDAGQGDP